MLTENLRFFEHASSGDPNVRGNLALTAVRRRIRCVLHRRPWEGGTTYVRLRLRRLGFGFTGCLLALVCTSFLIRSASSFDNSVIISSTFGLILSIAVLIDSVNIFGDKSMLFLPVGDL